MTARVAILNDDQDVALSCADWSPVRARAELVVLKGATPPEVMADFDVLVLMRERTAFPAALIERLPRLRMIALTGNRAASLDLAACARRGITVSNTGGTASTAATAECAWMLLLACARRLPLADAGLRAGAWQEGVPPGEPLEGKRLGVVGLGRLGSRVAAYGRAFGMEVVAWSQNLTAEAAAAAGVARVGKEELFATADAVSLHLVLSERSRGVVGERELAAMKRGAILVNTSRGPLVDEPALLRALRERRIVAGLDVFDTEPLPPDHELRSMRDAVLTPHLGYVARPVLEQFYRESVENVVAFLDGAPIRLLTHAG